MTGVSAPATERHGGYRRRGAEDRLVKSLHLVLKNVMGGSGFVKIGHRTIYIYIYMNEIAVYIFYGRE